MRIVDVRAFALHRPGRQGAYGGPFAALVRIGTDNDLVGWGEADSMPSVVKAIVEAPYHDELMSGIAALLQGEDPREPARLWARMLRGTSQFGRAGAALHAMAACDLALWDIAGQAARVPVHRLLGERRRDRLEVYATHPLGPTPEASAAFARTLVERGFTAIKMGWAPLGPDAERDEAIVGAIRAAVGPRTRLLIDGGNAWTAEAAAERCRRFAPYDLTWLEEPLAPEDTAGYRAVTSAAPMTIAAGELCATERELMALAEAGVGVIQIDVTRVGMTQGIRIAERVAALGARVVNHTYTHALNLAASLHLMAVAPAVSLCEVQAIANPLGQALFPDAPRASGGFIAVPDRPGLGVAPDPAALAEPGAEG
jgi:L-alanine-DL-glutamate epimerase-like enolase superfamily enzyme